MGMDIDDVLACLDGAVSDKVVEEKLWAMIWKGPDDDGMGGLSFVELGGGGLPPVWVEVVWSSDVVDGTHSTGPPWQLVYGED
eukprot:COSAG06_NODE_24351_length_665_cov_1.187279_1_plen_83_part_00